MYKLYVALLIIHLKIISVLSGDDPGSSSFSPNILPLIVLNLGKSCIIPDKIETIEKLKDSDDFDGENGDDYSGKTKFSSFDEPNAQQVFMCATEDLSETEPSDIGKYCLYSMKFDESDSLKCTHEPKPLITKYYKRTGKITLHDVPCGKKNNGRIYRLVYKICMTDEPNPKEPKIQKIFSAPISSEWQINPISYETEVEIYRFCYLDKEGVLYTEHTISSLNLLKDDRLQQEREKKFPISFDPSNPFNFPVETMKKDYSRVDSLRRVYSRIDSMKIDYKSTPIIEEDKASDPGTSPITEKVSYQQEKLVPSEDFALALWRKAAHSFFNFRRMRTDLVELWNHITFLIRENAIERNVEYYIQTSVFKLTLTQSQVKPIPEPNVWMKKIYYLYGKPEGIHKLQKMKAVAILMDGYFDTGNLEAEDMLRNRCGSNICENALIKAFPTEGKSIRCCSLIKNPNLQEGAREVFEDLEVEFLKNESNTKKRKEPFDTDQDALLDEIKRRRTQRSPSYDPTNRPTMESINTQTMEY